MRAVVKGLVLLGTIAALITGAPAIADAVGRDSLLIGSDLPPDFEISAGFPRTDLGRPPTYPTVDHCAVTAGEQFTGPAPTTFVASFTNAATKGTGSEAIFEFASTSTAKQFFLAMKPFFVATPKCEKVTAEVTSSGTAQTLVLGTFRTLDVGRLGDERVGAIGDPESGAPPTYYAAFRSGKSVTRLTLTGSVAQSVFVKLVQKASKRLAARK